MTLRLIFTENIRRICLPSLGQEDFELNQAYGMPSLSSADCELADTDKLLCSDESNSSDRSGSGLIRLNSNERWSILGVATSCSECSSDVPTVYTNVEKYADWIKDTGRSNV
jgi:secreted trypsin-like serine protease